MSTIVPGLSAVLPAGEPEACLIDRIVREGARRMLAAALQAEVDAYIGQFTGERGEHGRRLVVRNGTAEPRTVLTSAGAIEVTAPRVNDMRTDPETGQRMRFSSAILPPWARKTPQVTEVLPLLYLHDLSSGDFVPALGQFPGSSAGLSAPVITRLTEDWKDEARAFMQRDLSGTDYVYVWADGIHVNIGLEEARLCLLVMIGVRIDGRKELIALADGYRESTESWADLLRDCARRGMRAPVLAAGDGALGFWGALRDVFPGTREQRCWFHKIANVLDALPKSAHPGARKALAVAAPVALGELGLLVPGEHALELDEQLVLGAVAARPLHELDPHPAAGEFLDQQGLAGELAGQPVRGVDQHDVEAALGSQVPQRLQARPHQRRPGVALVGEHPLFGHLKPAGLGVVAERGQLGADRLVLRLPGAGDPGVDRRCRHRFPLPPPGRRSWPAAAAPISRRPLTFRRQHDG